MITPFHVEASSVAGKVDLLFDVMLALSVLVVVGVSAAILWFCVKYRRGSSADRSGRRASARAVELTWMLVPFALFVAVFVWSIVLYAGMREPPDDAAPIYVVAKQWMWKVQHPGGQREINALHVPLGRPIKLVMTSQDVIHSFYVPAFRVKQDVLPDTYTTLWFTATRAGSYTLFCAEFCGTDHSRMHGTVVVMQPDDYAHWLDAHADVGLAQRGAGLFREYGCSGCHGASASMHAPSLDGLYGHAVPLEGGGMVTADDRYIHDSIMLPDSQVAAGYKPLMPSFQGQIGEDDVLALIAYIKSRADEGERVHDRR